LVDGIADYVFLANAGPGLIGSFFLASPPSRLGLTVDRVMVKVIDGLTDEAMFRRGVRELRAFASVQTPYIVQLYDAGQDGSSLYYSMEFLDGGSLAFPSRPIERSEVHRAVAHAALAAHAMHGHGIAHRGIEPSTVLLHQHGAKLADLGLAQVLSPGQTVTAFSQLDGVEFMDPAVLRGASPSRAADIWSLGATLHRALSGRGLYGKLPPDAPLSAVRRVLSTPPSIDPDLDPAEIAVISTCLTPDPADRYPTAQALANAITTSLLGLEPAS
jgi:serine/threonine protein kinase